MQSLFFLGSITVIRDLPAQGIGFDDRPTSNQQEIVERKPLSI